MGGGDGESLDLTVGGCGRGRARGVAMGQLEEHREKNKAGEEMKKGENAEIFKKLHIDDCRVELKLKKRCSLFLKAYGFYKNMRNAIHPGVSHSRAGKIN